MAEQRIPPASEQIYLPRPSWSPAFAALGIALLVVGIFAKGFLVTGWVYSAFGAIILLVALRSMVATAAREFMLLPRRQPRHYAVLPAGTIRSEAKSDQG